MKILLINPPNSGKSIPEEQYGIKNMRLIFRGEPLALEVLAGNLEGHEVRITDLKAEPDSLWKDYEEFQPDLAGITGMTCEANAVLQIAQDLKKRSDLPVVVGGYHASCDARYFNREYIDYVVIGIGKSSFRELVNALEKGEKSPDIPGIARTNPGRDLHFTPRNYSRADLADHAAPRYDLVEKHRDKYVMSGVGGKMGFVASAFGCTHHCSFCCVPNLTGGKYLSHSADAVLRDMQMIGNIPLIRLVDANTFGNPKLAEELGQRILESGMKKRIVADVRSDTVIRHPELFRLWKQAGLETAVIGLEEVSDARLTDYNKKNAVQTNIAAMEFLKELGIRIIGDFIVSPDYTNEDFDALENFIENHPIDLPLPSILTPLPGTPLYEQRKEQIVIADLDYYTFLNAVLPTRMEEREFYETYSALLEKCIRHVRH
ncbi:MAG: radical SAM protein [Desulfococcaceae bacterium]